MPADLAPVAPSALPSPAGRTSPALSPLAVDVAPRRPALGLAVLYRYSTVPPYPLLAKRSVPCAALPPSLDGLPYAGTSDGIAVYSNLAPVALDTEPATHGDES